MASFLNTCNGTNGAYYNLRLYYTLNSQNTTNRTSNITLSLKQQSNNSTYSYYGYSQPASITINGSTVASQTTSPDLRSLAERTLCSYTGNVTHGLDGTLTITVGGSFTSSYSKVTSGSVSGSWALTTINTIPTNITSLTLTPNPIKDNQSCVLSYSGATTPNGTIDYYHIYSRLYNGSSWGSYSYIAQVTGTSYTHNVKSTYSTLTDGNRVQYKILTHNTTGGFSTGVESATILDVIASSTCDLNVGGTWKNGTPWIKVGSTWTKGIMWLNAGGTWKKGK